MIYGGPSVADTEVKTPLLVVKWKIDYKVIFILKARDHLSTEVHKKSGERKREIFCQSHMFL